MTDVEPDSELIAALMSGDANSWRTTVHRYQGRLSAYARSRLKDEHEDVVQETFISMLQSLGQFRGQCSLETWLFGLLRRRIADRFRRLGHSFEMKVCQIDDAQLASDPPTDPITFQEEIDENIVILRHAIESLAGRWRQQKRFEDLMIAEGIFFAGAKNASVAKWIGIQPSDVASRKSRILQQLHHAAVALAPSDRPTGNILVEEGMLKRVWQTTRPTCPKRSVIGRYVLDVLPDDWQRYVEFHVERIQCGFCQSSVDEFQNVPEHGTATADRLFQSTINFLRT
ncbi:MAG: RNA polymerase sigma factor [Planctomycetota bacterium]